MFASELRKRVRDRQPTMGVLISFDFWPGHIEMFKAEGLHFAVLDMEHSTCGSREAEDLLRTARLIDFPVLIRPEASVHHLVKKYMDMGASGIMLPWTESVEQIETLRDAVFTPPKGRRGPGGPAVFANRTLDRAGWDEVEEGFFLLPQIESPQGMANAAAIAAAPWIDALMLGPYDLSLNLSRWGDLDHPEVVESIRQISRAAASAGKPCGMVVGTPEKARFWMDEGLPLILIPDPSFLARQRLRTFLDETIRSK